MVLPLQRHKPRARNSGCEFATRLERLYLVIALMYHKRRYSNLAQQVAHIQVSGGLEITVGTFGCCCLALQLSKFLKLFLRTFRHEERREQRTKCGSVLPPSCADQGRQCLRFL